VHYLNLFQNTHKFNDFLKETLLHFIKSNNLKIFSIIMEIMYSYAYDSYEHKVIFLNSELINETLNAFLYKHVDKVLFSFLI
jgi:hypothetical protein